VTPSKRSTGAARGNDGDIPSDSSAWRQTVDFSVDRAHIRRMRKVRIAAGSAAIALLASVVTSAPAWAGSFERVGPTSGAATETSWTVPEGVEIVQVVLQGAGGGNGHAAGATARGGTGGLGANIEVSIDVIVMNITVLEIGLGVRGGDGGVNANNVGGASPFGFGPGGRGGQVDAVVAEHYGGGGGGLSAVRIPGRGYLLTAAGGGGGGSAVESNIDGAQNPRGGAGGLGTTLGGPIIRTGDRWLNGRPGSSGSDPSNPPAGQGGNGGTETPDGQRAGIGGAVGGSNGVGSAGGAGGTNQCSGGGGGAGWQGGGGGGRNASAADWGCGGGGAGLSIFEGGNRTTSTGATSSTAFGQINWISFNTTSLPAGQVGSGYSQQIEAFFGSATTPNAWSVTPALPAGMALNPTTGAISGAPTVAAAGNYTVTATYEDAGLGGLVARSSRTFALTISSEPGPPGPIPPGPGTPSGGGGGGASPPTPNQQVVPAPALQRAQTVWTLRADETAEFAPSTNSGGASTYSIEPALPPGLSLNTSTGVISGEPTQPSTTATYVLRATNASGTSSVEFVLEVTAKTSVADSTPDSRLGFVTFKRGTAKLTRPMRTTVMQMVQGSSRAAGELVVETIVPRSASAQAERLAMKRGIQIRRLLRTQGMKVQSKIEVRPAAQPSELRRVEILSRRVQ
jgi:hypothetical protein